MFFINFCFSQSKCAKRSTLFHLTHISKQNQFRTNESFHCKICLQRVSQFWFVNCVSVQLLLSNYLQQHLLTTEGWRGEEKAKNHCSAISSQWGSNVHSWVARGPHLQARTRPKPEITNHADRNAKSQLVSNPSPTFIFKRRFRPKAKFTGWVKVYVRLRSNGNVAK